MENNTIYKTVTVNGLNIFYREAGAGNARAILLLHGFPSSSHMYRNLLAGLSGRYHVIAPDYPGFGNSSCLPPDAFEYSFDNLAGVMEQFIDALGLKRFSLYVQDYGGPVGFRIASKRPELIEALLIQNANAYMEGLGPFVKKIWSDEPDNTIGIDAAIDAKLTLEGIMEEYQTGVSYPERISPDAYLMDYHFIARPGNKAIQATLFKNYPSNFLLYEQWQQYFRQQQPPALIIWGKGDPIFIVPGAKAYTRDLKNAELHILDGGHFVLEEQHRAAAALIEGFLARLA
jgi:pimeloyl-ACP methyl ester carboxylesterase